QSTGTFTGNSSWLHWDAQPVTAKFCAEFITDVPHNLKSGQRVLLTGMPNVTLLQWNGGSIVTNIIPNCSCLNSIVGPVVAFVTGPQSFVSHLALSSFLNDPTVAATVNPTGGGTSGGSLPPGTYYIAYTWTETTTSPVQQVGETTLGWGATYGLGLGQS